MSSAVIRAAGNTLKYLLSPAARDKVVHSLGNKMINVQIHVRRRHDGLKSRPSSSIQHGDLVLFPECLNKNM